MFHQGNASSVSNARLLPRDRTPTLLASLTMLWHLKWWAIAGGGVLVALALAFALIVPPRYEATAQLYINPQDLQILNNGLNPGLSPGDSGVVIVESESRVMQSESVLRAVVDKLGLAHDPEFVGGGNGITATIAGLFGLARTGTTDAQEQAVAALDKAVHVMRADRTYIISVNARSTNGAKAAQIANAVVSVFLAQTEKHRAEQADAASGALHKRLAGLEADLHASEGAVEQYKTAHNIVQTNSGLLVESRLNAANTAVAAADQAVADAEVRLAQLNAMVGNPKLFLSSPEAVNSLDMQRLGADLDAAEVEVSSLAATLGPRHPQLVAAQSRLRTIEGAITTQIQRMLELAKTAKARAVQQHDAAVADVQRITAEMQRTNTAQIELRQLERQVDSRRALYEEALNRSQQTSEQGQINTLNARVVSEATPPLKRSFPPALSLLLPAALIFGLAMGSALGYGYESLFARRPRETEATRIDPETAAKQRSSPLTIAHPVDVDAV